jgi:glycosyltransferase involved in cell wall biosynthesis
VNEPYFVVLGNIEPRKNHWMLLQLWRRLIDLRGAAAPRLLVIGQRAWECENVVDLLERCEQLRGFVVEHPSCGDKELVNTLKYACALLYPSFVEGYGLPIAEALSLGVPVIASDLPVFREFAGEVPEYADPLDGRRWLELIEDYARPNSACRRAQIARMPAFVAPTWAQHFDQVGKLLEELDH